MLNNLAASLNRPQATCCIFLFTQMFFSSQLVFAERLTNDVAVFSALDKIAAQIKKLEAPIGEVVVFGTLKVLARVCYSRPPTESPHTTSFVEIVETHLEGGEKRLFSGWMFAESPSLNALEHPVFDVWLTGCDGPSAAENFSPDAVPSTVGPQEEGYIESGGEKAGDGDGRSHPRRRRFRR